MRPSRGAKTELPSALDRSCASRAKDAPSDQSGNNNAGMTNMSSSFLSLASGNPQPQLSSVTPPGITSPSSAMSVNTARYTAASMENAHDWILAVMYSSSSDAESASSNAVDALQKRGVHNGQSANTSPGVSRPRKYAAAAPFIPLEERIGLPELKKIMRAFQVFPSETEQHDTDNGSDKVAPTGVVDGSVAPPTPLFSRDELSTIATETLRNPHTTTPFDRQNPSEAAVARSPAWGKSQRTRAGLTSSLPASTPTFRKLSLDDFIHVVQSAVPSATLSEVRALLSKATSEAEGTVSWNELTAFLISRTQQKADLILENQRFVLGGPPQRMSFDDQHSSLITCVALEPKRHLMVTGCSDGAVRAWSTGSDLAYRGLLLKVKKWIVGLHWGCRKHVLYVVTMDRWVYILNSTTFGVVRIYHGRGIKESSASMKYAKETIGTVQVGGVSLRNQGSSARSHKGSRLAPMDNTPSSRSTTSPSRHLQNRRTASHDTRKERIQRLLFAAMKVHHTGRPMSKDATSTARSRRLGSCVTDAAQETMGGNGAQDSSCALPSANPPPGEHLGIFYSLSTAGAADALHQDNTPLTGVGRGPYVHQRLEEGVLAALVDPVTATVFHESVFQEDVLLLGTNAGDVFLFQVARHHHLDERKVLVARHVFRHMHRGRITKLDLLVSLQALVSSGDDGHVHITSLVTGQRLRSFYADGLPEQHASVTDFSLHPQLKMLLTVGPERRALVWEWSQTSPVAILNPANSPCCCGAFIDDRVLTVSREGTLHVFECKGFTLQQELSLAKAAALNRFGGTVSATRPTISRMLVIEEQQRVLCFGNFPLSLCGKWQVTSKFPLRYIGPHVQIFKTFFSRTFGQVLTVGTDGIVMTWAPRTGTNEFSFPLSKFSSATAACAPLRPTAVAMDVLQRRILTGFSGGITVVWCILNGRVERVLTAAPDREASLNSTSRASHRGRARKAAPSPLRRGTYAGPVSGESSLAMADEAAAPPPGRVVTAVGSFLRHQSISYIFALGSRIYVDLAAENADAVAPSNNPQAGEYSTTPESSWTVPAAFGDVVTFAQIDAHHIACATTSGAVFFYNFLFDRQEGAPLWAHEYLLSPKMGAGGVVSPPPAPVFTGESSGIGGAGALSSRNITVTPSSVSGQGLASGNTTVSLTSPVNVCGSGEVVEGPGAVFAVAPPGAVVSRISRMVALSAVHPRLLLVGQDDGTVSLWHTLRRVCLGAVNLTTAAGVKSTEKNGDPVPVMMDIDEAEGRLLVFGDGEGNVHVCRVEWKVLTDSQEQRTALSMPNLALYCQSPTPSKVQPSSLEMTASDSLDDSLAAERSLPVLEQLRRVHTFPSGLTLSDVCLVDANASTSLLYAAGPPPQVRKSVENTDVALGKDTKNSAVDVSPGASKGYGNTRLLVVCTGADYYARVFTLAGVPIGEFGMDEWDNARPSTFRFLGEPTVPPAVPLPSPLPGNPRWQQEDLDTIKRSRCHHDYLADLNSAHHAPHTMHFSRNRGYATDGGLPLCATPSHRRAIGGVVCFDGLDASLPHLVSRAASAVHPSAATDSFYSKDQVVHAATMDKSTFHRHIHVAGAVESGDLDIKPTRDATSEDPSGSLLLGPSPNTTSSAKRCLTPLLRRNVRNRFDADQHVGGILKRSYAHHLRGHPFQRLASFESSPLHQRATCSHLSSPSLSGSTSSSASDAVQTKTVAKPIVANEGQSGSASQHGAVDVSLGPLEGAPDSHESFADVLSFTREIPSAPPSGISCKVCVANDEPGDLAAKCSSMAPTDDPRSVPDTSSNRLSPLHESAEMASDVSLPSQPSSDARRDLSRAQSDAQDLPVTRRPSLLPAVAAGETSTVPALKTALVKKVVSGPLPAVSAAAHYGDRVASSGLASMPAPSSSALTRADFPLFAATIPRRSEAASSRQVTTPMMSYMSREGARLLENTLTATAREQLAALVPSGQHCPVLMGVSADSSLPVASRCSVTNPNMAAAKVSSDPFQSFTQPSGVYDQVGFGSERQKNRPACFSSTSKVRSQSVRGFLAQITSRMYVAPLEAVSKPSSELSRRPRSSATSSKSVRRPN